MRTALKWLGRIVLVVILLLVLVAGVIYALSERALNRTYEIRAEVIAIPTDSTAIAEGERLARIRGCYHGCHGEAAEGGLFVDDPMLGKITASDLTRVVHDLSDVELVRVIRHGVLPDGRSVAVMPSASFYDLTDEDLGAIIAFLRSLPRTDGARRDVRLGPLARFLMARGVFQLGAAEIDHDAPRLDPGDGSDVIVHGRYLAKTVCTECHGIDLSGGYDTPSLAIAASYTPEEFETLMRTGEPRDRRDLRLMDDMSRKRFSNFTDDEIEAVYAYLTTTFAGTRAAVSVDSAASGGN